MFDVESGSRVPVRKMLLKGNIKFTDQMSKNAGKSNIASK